MVWCKLASVVVVQLGSGAVGVLCDLGLLPAVACKVCDVCSADGDCTTCFCGTKRCSVSSVSN